MGERGTSIDHIRLLKHRKDMRIIYLHQYFTTPNHAGGVRSYEFAKRLTEKGIAVDMITSSAFYPVEKQKGEIFVSKRTIDNIDVHVVHTAYSNSMSFPRRILAFILFTFISSLYVISLKGRNMVFATSTPLTIAIPGLVAKTIHKIPMIFEVRDVWPDIPIAMGIIRNPILKKVLFCFESFIYSKSEKIITLSVGMEQELLRKKVPNHKIITIPNACDILHFREAINIHQKDALAEYRTTSSTKICLYAGTFGQVNNLDYVVDLAKEIKEKSYDVKFVLIGNGAKLRHLSDRVVSESLTSHVDILPPVPKRLLLRYLTSTDACLSTVQNTPALYNNSANKFFDALAAGRPIIINHGGWQADIITEHGLGLVLNSDFSESADRLYGYLSRLNKKDAELKITRFAEANYERGALFEKLYRSAIKPLLGTNSPTNDDRQRQ